MKNDIHPEYHEINVVMVDGTSYKTKSTFGKTGDTIRLDIDPKTHPAWTGVTNLLSRGNQLDKFTKRFSGIGAAAGAGVPMAPRQAAPAPAVAAPAEAGKQQAKGKKK